jgi:hypothetical protein
MKAVEAISEILKREGIGTIIGYPVNHILEYAAHLDIRPIIVRQERVGLHMADAISRMTSGASVGVFAMQHGPGSENAYGGIAQAYGESVPLLVMPMGYPRRASRSYAWVGAMWRAVPPSNGSRRRGVRQQTHASASPSRPERSPAMWRGVPRGAETGATATTAGSRRPVLSGACRTSHGTAPA